MTSLWCQIIHQAPALKARLAVDAILQSLPTPDQLKWGASLGDGHAGFALLFTYAALAEEGPIRQIHVDRARSHLETAIGLLPLYRKNPGLFAGYAGVAWVVDHLQQRGIVTENEDLNEEIDEDLLVWLTQDSWLSMPELIHGLAGIGLYALDRPNCTRSRLLVDRVLGILQTTSESSPYGTAWFQYPDHISPFLHQRHPKGAFNLGVAHGNTGIIGFLAEAWHRGFQGARPLLDMSISWLLSCRSPHNDGSIFGQTFSRGQPTNPTGGRLSWCYGDLGISVVMLLASVRAGQRSWREEAIRLALACTERPDPWQGVVDAGLCHGAAGNAHLFSRLYHGTGISRFKTSAQEFFDGALAMRGQNSEAGGFLANIPDMSDEITTSQWTATPGLLNGATGIGLCLLAATTTIEPSWDRHLLTHVPPLASNGT